MIMPHNDNMMNGYAMESVIGFRSSVIWRGYHQMVSTEIRLIIFFAVEDGDAVYSQQMQDQELIVA